MTESERFREWCGDEQFAKFVDTLETTCRQKKRLVFWQEALLEKFAKETGSSLPCSVDDLLARFAGTVERPAEAASATFSANGLVNREEIQVKLLSWAAGRSQAGLNRNLSFGVVAKEAQHPLAAEAVKELFLEEPQINAAFVGAIISATIRPPDAPTPSTGLTIHVDDLRSRGDSGSVCLQWTIESKEPKAPWWKVW